MFWRFLFAMFLASLIGVELFAALKTVYDESRLIRQLEGQPFAETLRHEFLAARPTLELAQAHPPLCVLALESLLAKSDALDVTNDRGFNSRSRMTAQGRLHFSFISNGQTVCHYPARPVSESEVGRSPQWQDNTKFVYNASWIAQDNREDRIQLELEVLRSPTLIWVETTNIPWNFLMLFIGFLNFCCAITLAPILVRRIKKAQVVARGWTEGNLQARISDSRNDEFGALTRSFNTLADSFVDLIRIKQELAAVDERNRLARDLHDTAKQRAFALNLQITALCALGASNPEESARLSRSASSLIQHLQKDLSNVIKRLSASTVAELGMREVLRQEVSNLLSGSGIDWKVQVTDDADSVLRDATHLAQQVLLIAIEATANVLRHSSARNMLISLCEHADIYTLTIEDDGRGLDATESQTLGMGLANMRLRANSLPGGEMKIANRAEGGVVVTVRFQL
jgi:signal transduction histidine kinase